MTYDPMEKNVTARVAMEVVAHEGLVREAYRDSVGVWTWSFGLTKATGHRVKRYVDNPQPLSHCLEIFLWALDNYAEAVRAEFRDHEMKENEFAAALSFHWNTGAIKSASWCDLWKSGDLDRARDSFMQWRKPPEIIDRRRDEAALLFDGEWINENEETTEYRRVHPNGTPDWSSARTIRIGDHLRSLLGQPDPLKPEPSKLEEARAEVKRLEIQLEKIRNIVEETS